MKELNVITIHHTASCSGGGKTEYSRKKFNKRKLKKLAKNIIGGCSCILAFISAGCMDSENLAPPIIVLMISLLILNRLYGEY